MASVRGPPMTPVRGPSSPLFGVLPDPCSGSFCHPCAGCLALTDSAVTLGFSESGALLVDLRDLRLKAVNLRYLKVWDLGVQGSGA